MLKIKPPTHRLDTDGIYIPSFNDEGWDTPRILAEMEQLEAAALKEMQDKASETYLAANANATDAEVEEVKSACKLSDKEQAAAWALHPVLRYRRGKTRYQPDAPDWDPAGKPVTVRSYLTEPATEFVFQRMTWQQYQRCHIIIDTADRLGAFIAKGLVAIRSPNGGFCWEKKGSEDAPQEILDALHQTAPHLITELGSAIKNYNSPLDDDENLP